MRSRRLAGNMVDLEGDKEVRRDDGRTDMVEKRREEAINKRHYKSNLSLKRQICEGRLCDVFLILFFFVF